MARILVPIDFSEITPSVIEHAKRLAGALGGGLRLLHVAPPDPEFVGYRAGPQTVRDAEARHLREERRRLEDAAAALSRGGTEADWAMVRGATIEAICAEAKEWGADLIVIGAHGRGVVARLFLGSVSEGVLRNAPCPVLVIPPAPA